MTGSVEFGAHVFMEAFAHGKHVVMMNAEVDATIGPILQTYAARGVTLSACDGDEPGLQMNLYRWVNGLGLIPRVVGNVKGLQDPYRNPTTQQAWAERWEQNPAMVTSFADGSKISFEQTIVANATGFKVRERGMTRGLVYDGSIMDIAQLYDLDQLRELGGVVDYTVGPAGVKVFVLAEHTDPKQRHYLNLYKMGEGPLYPFWVPYHLVHFETPSRSLVSSTSVTTWRPRSAARWWRSAPSPSVTCRLVRCSTSTACTAPTARQRTSRR